MLDVSCCALQAGRGSVHHLRVHFSVHQAELHKGETAPVTGGSQTSTLSIRHLSVASNLSQALADTIF